ncbi:unnamed protein product [Haemonchus placei]|uniref:CCHC-type domain-containing protein n=1 Tax=Haemonchus placei TaxID=6290 RepID=A0A0N4VU91_HAEPC|nr:unnamed protein product [Haemonchus placei]
MMPDQCMDFQMGSKLYECLAHWQDSYYMLAALDAPEGHIFEEVRKVALRLERTRRPSQPERRKPWTDRKAKVDVAPTEERGETSVQSKNTKTCSQCGELGHFQRNCPQKREQAGNARRKDMVRQRKLPASSTNETRAERPSFSTHLKTWCYNIRRSPMAVTKAYGEPCKCDVEVLGLKVNALVDTGSVISIISVGLLKLALDQGVDVDKVVTMLGEADKDKVLDASGNPMKFLMRIAVDVKVKGANSARVQLHVQHTHDTFILLGTNAMKALGIEVILKPESSTKQEIGRVINELEWHELIRESLFAKDLILRGKMEMAAEKPTRLNRFSGQMTTE